MLGPRFYRVAWAMQFHENYWWHKFVLYVYHIIVVSTSFLNVHQKYFNIYHSLLNATHHTLCLQGGLINYNKQCWTYWNFRNQKSWIVYCIVKDVTYRGVVQVVFLMCIVLSVKFVEMCIDLCRIGSQYAVRSTMTVILLLSHCFTTPTIKITSYIKRSYKFGIYLKKVMQEIAVRRGDWAG